MNQDPKAWGPDGQPPTQCKGCDAFQVVDGSGVIMPDAWFCPACRDKRMAHKFERAVVDKFVRDLRTDATIAPLGVRCAAPMLDLLQCSHENATNTWCGGCGASRAGTARAACASVGSRFAMTGVIGWNCDMCNLQAFAPPGADKPEGWSHVFLTAQARAPWGTCCATCAATMAKKNRSIRLG